MSTTSRSSVPLVRPRRTCTTLRFSRDEISGDKAVTTSRLNGAGVASGVHVAREIACAWTGIAWTMLLLTIKLGACPGLAGHFCNTLQYHVHVVTSYDKGAS
jgi:hypothetical protein